MIVGIGIDVLENCRMEQELARSEWRDSDGIFTPAEICGAQSSRKPVDHYAACFVVKESMLKALGITAADLAQFQEVEVRIGNEPTVVLHGRIKAESEQLGVRHIRFSVTRTRKLTGALVVLED